MTLSRKIFGPLLLILLATDVAQGQHRVLMQGDGRLAIVSADGQVEWEMPWRDCHDIHALESGHILIQEQMRRIVEIDTATKQIVWSYDAAAGNGNDLCEQPGAQFFVPGRHW